METVSWTRELDEMIREAVARYGSDDWLKVCQKLRSQHITPEQCRSRWESVLREQTVKGPWTDEEDSILRNLVQKFGAKKWSTIASYINGRIGKQCRERWLNHLSPTVSKDIWKDEEDEILINAQIRMGNKWAYISKLLPGRSENAVKNRYNSIASRNGVRKKRLGTFVYKSSTSKANIQRLHLCDKDGEINEDEASQQPVESTYSHLLKKATDQINARNQQKIDQRASNHQQNSVTEGDSTPSPVQQPTVTAEMTPNVPAYSYRNAVNGTDATCLYNIAASPSQCYNRNVDSSVFLFNDMVDTSEMEYPYPQPITSVSTDYSRVLQEEEITLQQFDSYLLSGNTIMGAAPMEPQLFEFDNQTNSIPNAENGTENNDITDTANELKSSRATQASSIAPVRLRPNARISTLNRGVYSSWDRDSIDATRNSTAGYNLSNRELSTSNSIGMYRRSNRYESLDIMKLLSGNDTERGLSSSINGSLEMDIEDNNTLDLHLPTVPNIFL